MSLVKRQPPSPLATVGRILSGLLPEVNRQLSRWRARLTACPEKELARQATLSIRYKRFHCQGGAVYALYYGALRRDLVRLIVALQTISDYLDNLCDRAGCQDQGAFRHLHRAMLCAVDPDEPIGDFYARYPLRDDGGYLRALVVECRSVLRALPSYPAAKAEVKHLVGLYADLQVYKHTEVDRRLPLLTSWFETYKARYPDLYWWEFAAASGSTLGMFALFAAAARPGLTDRDVRAITGVYFPWIAGLHILLDYFIDQAEDRDGGDLNFVSYYPSPETAEARMLLFLRRALAAAGSLPRPGFHQMVVRGLPALYLSDPKVRREGLQDTAAALLREAGLGSRALYQLCSALRRLKVI
ncbi:MAG: tetraprenyl-beta-curcumene synthase family protein [Thermoanaerobacterales bacterium]|nr:tetraprenyl-beta-curcumene synthase family protein [Bacillota bacterium]MDI6907902.1 tetraprenyl-beta-curcumene synthase family protein [Thermoanaerobacterales bacterium]